MTPDELRGFAKDGQLSREHRQTLLLGEIAAQLAEMNATFRDLNVGKINCLVDDYLNQLSYPQQR